MYIFIFYVAVLCLKLWFTCRRSDIRHNSIWKLCPEMTRLVGLVSLDLSNIGLNETPEGFGKLRHLRFLDLSRNFLFWIKEPHIINEIHYKNW